MRWRWLAWGAVWTVAALAGEDRPGARVLILANSDDPGSLRIAQHYAAARDVPVANLIALKLPLAESISWREFVDQLWRPLIERLVRERWLDAVPMALTDPVGRQKFAPYSHRIAALVVCRGVPLKIAHDPALAGDSLPFTRRGEFRTNAGGVDSELSLLPAPNYNINAFVPNPLFQVDPANEAARHVVKVGRLDGPTVDDAIGLVDRAVAAERAGLLGRAYVDFSDRDPVGNEWLESAVRQLADLPFDLVVDREAATIPAAARFDAPVLYFGWYAPDVNGPFVLPGFRFPPGAIALHIHSYSASSLRTPSTGWVAPFVARGVTATMGNVNEPYLGLTHRPDLLLRALARGATLGEAAYHAISALSWQGVLIGDPLYRPFGAGAAPPSGEPAPPVSPLGEYAWLRRMRDLDGRKRPDEARRVGEEGLRQAPGLALALAVAERARAAGDADRARDAFRGVVLPSPLPADHWGLVAEAAGFLDRVGEASRAVGYWRSLLAADELPQELRRRWLAEALAAATRANEAEQASRWRRELAESVAPQNE